MAFAVTAVALAGAGAHEQSKARKQQKMAARLEARRARFQRERQLKQQVREANVKRAQSLNIAAQTGVQDSSAVSGAISSIGTQLGSNLGYIQSTGSFAEQIAAADQRTLDFQGKAQIYNSLSQLAGAGAGRSTPNNAPIQDKSTQAIFK